MPRVEGFQHITEKLPDPSAVIVYNPGAGGRIRSQRNIHSIRGLQRALEQRTNLHVEFSPTHSAEHAHDIVGRAINRGRGLVIVKGGDGTIAPIANQLTEANHETHLAIIGGGTQNVLRRELTRHHEYLKVADDVLFNGRPVQVDIGMIEAGSGEYPFLSCSGIGMDAHVLDIWEKTGEKNRLKVGLIYLKEKGKFEPYDVTVANTYGDQTVETKYDDIVAMPIVNVGKYGGWFHVTQSNMTDGALEGILVPSPITRTLDSARVALQSVQGNKAIRGFFYTPLHDATIQERNGNELIFQHDGERQRADSSEIRVFTKSNAITLWTPDVMRSQAFDRLD